jgi:predicted RNase H-like HicB family nuclease
MTWFQRFRLRRAAPQVRDIVFEGELDREADGRWIADVEAVPGALAFGATEEEATATALAVALRTLADRLEHEESTDPVVPLNVRLVSRECVAQ